MGFLRAQITIPNDDSIPADAAMNVLHFETPGAASGGVVDAHLKLTTFYQAIDGLLSSDVASPATVKYYDLEDPNPRVPIATDTITLTPGSTNGLPAELAICLSYQADALSGVSQARRRGRIYFGPNLVSTLSTIGGGRVVVSPTAVTTLTNALSGLATAAPLNAIWSVFSPTTAGPEPWSAGVLSSAFAVVTNGWVDNAWDIQRRRGIEPTIRTTWT